MKKRTICVVSGLLLSVSVRSEADTVVLLETLLPEPAVSAIHFDAGGKVSRIDFADESTISDPEISTEQLQEVDIVKFYHLPVDYLVMEELESGLVVRGCHVGSSWYWPCDEGVLRLADWKAVEFVDAKGNVISEPYFNLADQDIENVRLIDHLAVRLVEYRAGGSDKTQRGILRLDPASSAK